MKKELVDYLVKKLRPLIEKHINPRMRAIEGNQPELYWTDYVKYEVLGPNSIKMQYDHGYSFNFENVTPIKVVNEKAEPAVVSGKDVTDVDVNVIKNDGSEDLDWSFNYTTEESTEDTNNVHVGLTIGLEQTIGYGGELYGASGETRITAEIEASYDKTLTSSSSKSKEQSIDIVVPSGKSVTVSQERSIAKYKQNISMEAQFDFQLRMVRDNYWDFVFTDLEDLQDCINGTAQQNQHSQKNRFISFQGSMPNLEKYLDDLGGLEFSQTRRFNKATSGSVIVTES